MESQRRSGQIDALGSGRIIRYIFSDSSVARDNHVIKAGAWDLTNFLSNPVFLWAHDQDSPPIGKVTQIAERGDQLVGAVEYLDRDISPFADSIYQMTKGGFLNATSVSWLPVEWKYSSDRSRPGGIDFSRVELLEISQVPVPALPSALATARARGIDTAPIFDWATRMLDSGGFAALPRAELEALRKEARMPAPVRAASDWKCGASRDLEINHTAKWDGPEAEGRILDAATHDGKIDIAKAAKGFLLHDGSGERGGFKEPFADIVDGNLTAIASGIRAAAARLPDVKGPSDSVKAEARAVLDAYEAKMTKSDDDSRALADQMRRHAKALRKRGLYELSSLCDLIGYADYVCRCVEQEANNEGDGSPVPARMRAWVDEGNRIIADMAAEETSENIQGTQDVGRQVEAAVTRALEGLSLAREGKRLSADNERCLRAAHGHIMKAAEHVKNVVDPADDENPEDIANDPGEPDGATGDETDRAFRVRKAAAAKRRISLV